MRDALLVSGLGVVTLALFFALGSGDDEEREVRSSKRVGRALFLSGSAREKGLAHGRLLGAEIRARLRGLKPAEQGVAEFAIHTTGQRMLPVLPPALREELEGIAVGARIELLEALFLNTNHELAGHGLVTAEGRFDGPAAVAAAGPVALQRFSGIDPASLVVFVHEDYDPPLVLVGLPGMLGGFLGVLGKTAAVLRPMASEVRPVLTGVPWPVLLRSLLETSPTAGAALPLPPTLAASVPMVRVDGEVGSLNLSPAGATWYPGFEGHALASEDPVTGEGGRIALGRRTAAERLAASESARALMGAGPSAGTVSVRLKAGRAGVELTVDGAREVVRFRR